MDRNCCAGTYPPDGSGSLSARRAWIEIITQIKTVTGCVVALRKESVDRNQHSGIRSSMPCVALRKESVDRNNPETGENPVFGVALRKESVDRNW